MPTRNYPWLGVTVPTYIRQAGGNGRLGNDALISLKAIDPSMPAVMVERQTGLMLARLIQAARAAGHVLSVGGGYRTYEQQVAGRWPSGKVGVGKPNPWFAPEGTSNHGWGLAVDLTTIDNRRGGRGGMRSLGPTDPVTQWLKQMAPLYGFSWERDDEAWHVRYVGYNSSYSQWANQYGKPIPVGVNMVPGGDVDGKRPGDIPPPRGQAPVQNVGGGGGGYDYGLGPTAGTPVTGLENLSPEERVRAVYGEWGWLAAFFDHPEIGPILRQAIADPLNPWSPEKLRSALYATNWWKTTSENQRLWDAEEATDPAESGRKIDTKIAELQDQLAAMGMTMAPARLRDFARVALRNGMSDDEVQNALAAEMQRDPNLVAGTLEQQVDRLARSYGLPMTPATLRKWTMDMVSGDQTQDTLAKMFADQAAKLYPTVAQRFGNGETLTDVLGPYAELAGNLLGRDASEFDPLDTKFLAALNVTGKDGQPQNRTMTFDEWQRFVRSDQRFGWQGSRNAMESVAKFASDLGRTFGAYA